MGTDPGPIAYDGTAKFVSMSIESVLGFKPEQLDVQLTGDALTVTGKQEEEKEEKIL